MSEIPRDTLALLPDGEEAFGGDIRLEDVKTLRCSLDGQATRIVHYPDHPKPWEPTGWLRIGVPAFAKLLRRLYFAPDVALRLDADQVPLWLRPSWTGEVTGGVVGAANGAIAWSSRNAPAPVRDRLRGFRQWVFSFR